MNGWDEETDDRGVTVVEDGHRVEEMRDEAGAVLYCIRGDIGGCDAVEWWWWSNQVKR